MPLYTYVCSAGHSTEKLAPRDREGIFCACGKAASRQAVYRIGFSGFASTPKGQQDFQEDYRRFREASEGIDDQASKVERNEGVQLSSPLFKLAKKRAAMLDSMGVSSDQITT